MSESVSPNEPPKPKRSFFKRPAWAAQSTSTKSDGPDTPTSNLFDRSDAFDSIIAERQRKKQEQNAKKKVKEENSRSGDSHEVQDILDEKPGTKRRRISDLDDGLPKSDHRLSNQDKFPESASDVDLMSERHDEVPITTKAKPPTRPRRDKAIVYEIESDANSDEASHGETSPADTQPERVSPQASSGAVQSPSSDSESDPELADLKRKARQRRRLAEKEEQERAKAQGLHGSDNQYPSPAFDPRIQILVTSPVPNTTPLIVSRRLSQRLKEVKEAWFGRQNFPPDFHISQVFFTYRLNKYYDATTCKSLGIKVDSEGKIIPDDRSWADEDETGIGGEHEGKIHLEVMTEDLLYKMRAAKTTGRQGSSMLSKASNDRLGDKGTPMQGGEDDSDKEPLIRITLKAKGFKDAKLKVKPSTTYVKIANAARQLFGKQKPIPADQILTLVFDGEPLEPPNGLIRDTEIEDKDGVEVYFK